jgi:hypothetical protein
MWMDGWKRNSQRGCLVIWLGSHHQAVTVGRTKPHRKDSLIGRGWGAISRHLGIYLGDGELAWWSDGS